MCRLSDDGAAGPPPVDAKCAGTCGADCDGAGLSDSSDETECAPVRADDGAACAGGGANGGTCGWCGWVENDACSPPLSRTELAPDTCIGDISLPGPELSPRPRPPARYDPRSLRCREWPLLRPGGGFDSPVLWEKGGERCRCVVELGGGAGCCGPAALRFRGDSPTV